MINKKLITSLCKVSFDFGEYSDETQYQLYYDNPPTTRINVPEPQYIYLHNKVAMPDLASGSEVYVKHGNDLFKYHLIWNWNFDEDLVEGDILIPATFGEIKFSIQFNRGEPVVSGQSYYSPSDCAKEDLPETITDISNNTTVVSAEAEAFATDYTKNEFKLQNGSDDQKHRFYKTGWIDQHNQPFVFETTKVTEDKILKPAWEIKKWNLTLNYNKTFYNDITSYIPTNTPIVIYDRFSLKTSPNYNSSSARSKFTVSKSISYAISNFNTVSGTIQTYPTWYWDSARTSAFPVNHIMEEDKTIYAKWGATSEFVWNRYSNGVWDDTAKNYSKHNSISESSFLCPSFANSVNLTITSGGGNSVLVYGASASPPKTEKVETTISKPGSNGASETVSGSPKKKFRYFIGGSQQASWLKDDASINKSPAAGVSGGEETGAGSKRFNLHDSNSLETSFGSPNIETYLLNNWKSGQTIYTNWGSQYTTGTNKVRARFVGVCNTTASGRKNDDSTITVFFQVQKSLNNGTVWSDLLNPTQVKLGTLYYRTWESGGEGENGANEHTEIAWSADADYSNTNPHRWSYNGNQGTGFGGFACYSTCKDSSGSKANSASFCYGDGGGLRVKATPENIGIFS